MPFIDNLSEADISEQVASDFSCIKKEIFGDRNWDHIKSHIGRIAGTKLIGFNRVVDCNDDNEVFGGVSNQQFQNDCVECATAMGIEVPVAGEITGSIATRLMWRVILKIAENANLEEWIEKMIRSWID